MKTPAILWLLIAALGIGVNVAEHGKPKTGTYNLGVALLTVLIDASLLYWGGFFR
jgi:hypothetical protein